MSDIADWAKCFGPINLLRARPSHSVGPGPGAGAGVVQRSCRHIDDRHLHIAALRSGGSCDVAALNIKVCAESLPHLACGCAAPGDSCPAEGLGCFVMPTRVVAHRTDEQAETQVLWPSLCSVAKKATGFRKALAPSAAGAA